MDRHLTLHREIAAWAHHIRGVADIGLESPCRPAGDSHGLDGPCCASSATAELWVSGILNKSYSSEERALAGEPVERRCVRA